MDPQEPGGYTKQPLSLVEKARRYPEFMAASPRGLVPAVTYFGHHVWESMHVVEYIDAVFTGKMFLFECCVIPCLASLLHCNNICVWELSEAIQLLTGYTCS